MGAVHFLAQENGLFKFCDAILTDRVISNSSNLPKLDLLNLTKGFKQTNIIIHHYKPYLKVLYEEICIFNRIDDCFDASV